MNFHEGQELKIVGGKYKGRTGHFLRSTEKMVFLALLQNDGAPDQVIRIRKGNAVEIDDGKNKSLGDDPLNDLTNLFGGLGISKPLPSSTDTRKKFREVRAALLNAVAALDELEQSMLTEGLVNIYG